MKIPLLFLLLGCLSGRAQIDVPLDLRIVGTNLYDFTHAAEIYHLGGVAMRVVKIYPQSVQIEINQTHMEFVADIDQPTSGDPSDMLRALSQFRTANDPNHKLSAGAAWMMGINGHEEPVITTITIHLLHPQGGYKLDCYAVPTKIRGFWDCGEPFSGDPLSFKYIYRVTDRITAVRQYSPEEILANEIRLATNNVASDQFILSRRYLAGDGVPTNRDLAMFWMHQAASNSYPDAIKFLQTNSAHSTP